ncbi:MAG: DUF1552 domain-containing protein [Myxococcota bacterium]
MKEFKHTGRRAFLRGLAGGVLALPLLELTHGRAWSQDGSASQRFLTVFSHGGTAVNQGHSSLLSGNGGHHGANLWRPTSAPGEPLVLNEIMQPLVGHESKLLVVDGVTNMAASKQAQYGSGGHGISNVTSLTAADVSSSGDGAEAQGPSIDHVIAERLAARQPVKFKRIHLNVKGHQYGSPYYRGAGQRVSGIESPAAAFETIFEGVSADAEPDPEFIHRQDLRRSVVDGVLDHYRSFRPRVSQRDKHTIDAHLEHLHALESELNAAPVRCEPPTDITAPGNAGGDVVGPLQVDIIVAALRCGLTNVANLEIGDILTPWTTVGTPMNSAFGIGHSLGHYAREVGATGADSDKLQDWLDEMRSNRQWRMGLFKRLLEGLDDPDFLENGRTLLDNSLMLWTSEFSSPALHCSAGIPLLMAGSAGGRFQTGRLVDFNLGDRAALEYETEMSTHNLFTSVLQAFGGDDTHFGSGHATHTGPMPNLT